MAHATKNVQRLRLPLTLAALLAGPVVADEYEWLEDVLGEAPLAWVQEQDNRSLPQIERERQLGVQGCQLSVSGLPALAGYLSDGGADAVVAREFDMETLSFVEDGFTLPEAKPNIFDMRDFMSRPETAFLKNQN